ncbi:MAG: DUF5018 domain-containing protein [Tannerellaceae bacterium]|jgi:hypothetical protein|nr:DUF5018 domain-containing protein [Tannerellaceae bacterium]
MNKDIVFLRMIGFIMMLTSCLGSNDESDVTAYKDAQIASFVLSHDSIAGLNTLKFTIDQINGQIFNIDSLPYGTRIEKAICTVTYRSGSSGVQVVQEALGDSLIAWNGTDSLDFSKPVRFTVYAYDGATRKNYSASVNIHRVNPDSMVWERYLTAASGIEADEMKVFEQSGGLYMYLKTPSGIETFVSSWPGNGWTRESAPGLPLAADISQITVIDGPLYGSAYASADGKLYRASGQGSSWSEVTGTPVIRYILGSLRHQSNRPALLAAIVEIDGALYFASMTSSYQWTQGSPVPDNFPVRGFGSTPYKRMENEYLMIATGRDVRGRLLNTVWATSNGMQWTQLTRPGGSYFSEREGATLVQYGGAFYLTGGFNADGSAPKEIYSSPDNGISWGRRDSLILFPAEYAARGYASVATFANSMYIFGGKTSPGGKHRDEIWRGHINRLLFEN